MRAVMPLETRAKKQAALRMRVAACTGLAAAFALAAPAASAASVEEGRQKAEQICAACHGKDGNTPLDPTYPRLAGQYQDYLAQALRDYQSDQRKNPIMGAQAKTLSPTDVENVAAYFASLPGTITNTR